MIIQDISFCEALRFSIVRLIVSPLEMRHSWRPVSCYLCPIIVLTVLYNLPRFWELRLGPISAEDSSQGLKITSRIS